MFILDTSAIIEIINGTQNGKRIINETIGEMIFTTCFSVYEINLGAKQKEIPFIEDLFENLEVLNFDYIQAKESATIYKKLSIKGMIVNEIDIFIASICLLNNMTLVTTDKDFLRIPNLKIKHF